MGKSAWQVSCEFAAVSKMGFDYRAWLFVLVGFDVCGNVWGEGWTKPELIDIQNPNVILTSKGDNFYISIAEEIKSSTELGIQLNYIGEASDLTVTCTPNYFSFETQKNDLGMFLIVTDSPDFEQGSKVAELSISSGDTVVHAYLDLTNIDDNEPQAMLLSPTCNIKENSLEIDEPCLITVEDADGCVSSAAFDITGQDGFFSIINVTESSSMYPDCLADPADLKTSQFKLNLLQKLDFEKVRSYFLSISYRDGGNNQGAVPLQLVIQVQDVADMPPMWVQIVSTKTVNEEEAATIHVEARDQDVGIDADICYKMKSLEDDLNDDEKNCFSMKNGDISICKILRDVWQRNSYSLQVTAYECNDQTSFVEGTLVLQVLDSINKNFTYQIDGTPDNVFPKVLTDENEVISFANTVTVTDPDEGNAGTFTAKLDNPKFMVLPGRGLKSATFVIQGLAPLDYENPDEREFTMNLVIEEVQDKSHKATIPITVQVNNVNDNPPVFSNLDQDKALHVKIREDFDTGTLIVVQATDADGDTITYGMVSYSGLEIDPQTGDITATETVFDYEQQHTVVLQITASDEGDVHTTYVTLKVEVEDVNDTPPTIRVEAQSTPEVFEDAPPGSEVDVTISATDPDTTAKLDAKIDWESSTGTKNNQLIENTKFNGWFDVAMDNGKVKIIVAQELKWDVIDTIQLKITVTDSATERNTDSSQTTVSIIIKDVNNHAPEFGPNCGVTQTLQFQENAPKDLVIGTVTATDLDGPGYNSVIYSLRDVNEKRIKIDANKGLISTGEESVDYEIDQTITVVIVATDAADETLENSCSVLMEIIDMNDEEPVGTADPNKVTIPEDTKSQFKIAHVVGVDKDLTPSFAEISYSLNTFSDYFKLIPTDDGVDVVVNFASEEKYFDYDGDVKKYELSVLLTDYPGDPTGGRLQLYSITPITVELSDVNDNAPVLSTVSERDCFFTVPESTQGDAPLTGDSKLVATDADSNENSWISYTITDVECELDTMKECPDDKKELFKVSGNTETVTQNVKADIRSNKTLINKYGEYLVTVVAEDHGDPVLPSKPQKYRFCITDENNNYPVIDYDQRIVIKQDDVTGQLVNYTNGAEIQPVKATDDDFDKNGEVTFTLEPNDVFNLQSQGSNKAKLVLVKGDLSEISETVVTINACDSPAEEPKCSKQSLTIITPYNKEVEPVFSQSIFDSELQEIDPNATVTLPKAADRNNDDLEDTDEDRQVVYYFITAGEPEDYVDYFTLGVTDPVLSLKKPLDAYICDQYLLTVQTTNTPKPPLPTASSQSLLSVNITVEDINDKFPVFDRDQYTISTSSVDEGRNLLTLRAIDPDRHDTVNYEMDSSSIDASHLDATVDTTDMFSIERNTGAVKLNRYPTTATRGYVTFTASATDGIHKTDTQVSVHVVSEQYLIPVQFANTEAQVTVYLNEIAQKLTEVFEAKCISGPASGGKDYATIRVHFENENSIPIEPTEIISVTNNVTAMEDLKSYLREKYELLLVKIGTDAVKDDAPEEINTALIAVSAVLAALLVASAVFFFIKHRNMMKHVDRLTKASTETSLEAKGTVLPNTNQNIGIGSNPLYNAEVSHDLDSISTTSSRDSDLIGIEENPEFDRFYSEMQQRAKATGTNMDDILRENPQLRGLQITNETELGY